MAGYEQEQSTPEIEAEARTGLISVFARHRTAPNILVILMLAFGVWAGLKITSQFLPDFVSNRLTISENWSGAAAEDIDTAIVQVIEPGVRFLEGVEDVFTSSQEGRASIAISFASGTNMSEAQAEVDAAINSSISSLPDDANDPTIRRSAWRDVISRVVLSGPLERAALLEFAEEVREDLLNRGLLEVNIVGNYRPEIRITPDPAALRRLDMTIQQLASVLANQSQNTPAGDIAGGSRLIRTLGQKRTAIDYQTMEVKALPDGSKIILSEIALVKEIDAANGVQAFRDGKPAVELIIQRGPGGDNLRQQVIIDEYLEDLKLELPQNLQVGIYNIRAEIIKARLNMLIENGILGMIIVLLLLFLFLNWRTAFWVAAGIPISLAAAIGVMYLMGQSINMISMFALIISLGIIVDDAIVVGEHADHLHRSGFSPSTASVIGAKRMAGPVVSSALTTLIAFGAILMISGPRGQFIKAIPLAIVAVLVASLIECFYILPGHMRHSLSAQNRRASLGAVLDWIFSPVRKSVDFLFDGFRLLIFRPLVKFAIIARYPVIAACGLAFVLALSLVLTREVAFQRFNPPELNIINTNVEMLSGSKRSDTLVQLQEMQRALDVTVAKFAEKGKPSPITMSISKLGARSGRSRGAGGSQDVDLLGSFSVEIREESERDPHFTTTEFKNEWTKNIKKGPKVSKIAARSFRGGGASNDVDVRLVGDNLDVLKTAAGELVTFMGGVNGLSGIEDDLPYGKSEYQLRVTERGTALGFNATKLGQELRGSLEGVVVERFPRDNREVSVRIKMSEDVLDAGYIFNTDVRSDTGEYVPLAEIVDITETQGFAIVRRVDGQRQVSVTADMDDQANTLEDVQREMEETILPELQAKYDIAFAFDGAAREEADLMKQAAVSFLVALVGIYLILAWVFSSFFRPLAVMLIIPMGFVGMVLGHWFHGIAIDMFSIIGFIGLTGIVVNDSIVLVTTVDRRAKIQAVRSAIVDGVTDRLRAVLLTSATTIGGLMPLLFETSVQAKFLIPTVITMIWGLGLGTILVLFVVPSLVAIQTDISKLLTSLKRFLRHLLSGRRRSA